MHLSKSILGGAMVAATLTLALGSVSCVGEVNGAHHGDEHARAPAVESSFVPRAPEQSIFSSAATPLGWETASERRLEEWRFATGEDVSATPPDAIGGGPEDFDDED